MEFAFLDERIKELCERRSRAVAELGEEAARELERRLADIEACDNAAEFAALSGDELVTVSGHRRALHLACGISMAFVSGHTKPRLTETGATDWRKVMRLRIEAIGGGTDE